MSPRFFLYNEEIDPTWDVFFPTLAILHLYPSEIRYSPRYMNIDIYVI